MTTDVFFYYNVAAALILVGGAVWATTCYWRKRTAWQRQIDSQRLSLELFRADVARESALKTCKNNRDVMSHVLRSLQKKKIQERLLAQANSMLGVLAHARSFRLRRRLFGSYPMYTFANGSSGMVKFIMNSETKQELCQALKKN